MTSPTRMSSTAVGRMTTSVPGGSPGSIDWVSTVMALPPTTTGSPTTATATPSSSTRIDALTDTAR